MTGNMRTKDETQTSSPIRSTLRETYKCLDSFSTGGFYSTTWKIT